MSSTEIESGRLPRRWIGLVVTGWITIAASLAGLVLGLVLVGSMAEDLAATVNLSRSAIDVIGDTIELLDDAAGQIDVSLDATVGSVEGASATASTAAAGLGNLAILLDEDLPSQIEAILDAMPAAIQAAGAIDGTLRALSLLGVDYSPEEPFDDSLRGIQSALSTLPAQLRSQSESVRLLVPAAADLSDQTGRLAQSLTALQEDLGSIQDLTADYRAAVAEAEATVAETESSLDGTMWLLRALVVAATIAGLAVGYALISIDRRLAPLLATDGGEGRQAR